MREFLRATLWGMPVYFWGTLFALGLGNEIIRVAEWTRALSIWQGWWRLFLWLPVIGKFARFPILHDVLRSRWFADVEDIAAENVLLRPTKKPPPIPPLTILALFLASCVCAEPGAGASCARKVVTGVDAGNGFAIRAGTKWVSACTADAIKLEKINRAEANKKHNQCVDVGIDLKKGTGTLSDITQVAADAIDIAEKAGQKRYDELLAPIFTAFNDLKALFKNHGVDLSKLPAILGVK